MNNKQTDFKIEMGRIDHAISGLGHNALSKPFDSERATKYVYLKYQRASLTGDLEELAIAEKALDTAISEIGPAGDLYFLKANLDFKLHRLGAVREDLKIGRGLSESLQGQSLAADLTFQEGNIEMARQGYEDAIKTEPTW